MALQDADFAAYVSARIPALRRLALVLCRDWHSADDLVQATLTKLHLQELCAADADGLFVYIYLAGNHPALSASRIFAHLHLLGPNPANWTTKPIG